MASRPKSAVKKSAARTRQSRASLAARQSAGSATSRSKPSARPAAKTRLHRANKKSDQLPLSKKHLHSSDPDLQALEYISELDTPEAADFLFKRLVFLYQHSAHARFSIGLIALLHTVKETDTVTDTQAVVPAEAVSKNAKSSTVPNKKQSASSEFDEPEDEDAPYQPQYAWLHTPYPYSGILKGIKLFIAIAVLSVIVQIMYPSGRTLPMSRLEANGYMGFKTQEDVQRTMDIINQRSVVVTTKDNTVTTTYGDMGIRANAEDTFQDLANYPVEKRLIPFSLLAMNAHKKPVSRDINVEKLTTFTKGVVTVKSKTAKNARVKMQGTQLMIESSEDGYDYDESSLQKQVATVPLGSGSIALNPRAQPARISTTKAQESVSSMQRRINSGLAIAAADQSMRISPETIAGWVVIAEKPEVGSITLHFDRDRVSQSLKPLIGLVDNNGVPDQVTLLNGSEAGRIYGSPGRNLQFDDLVNQVTSATDETVGLIQATVVNQPVRQVFQRSYSRDSAGIQSLLDYWAKSNKGRYSAVVQTESQRIQASVNGQQSYAGTYKLYLPHLMYGQIAARVVSPAAMTSTGFTFDGCIDKVILSGHDGCAQAIGSQIGWEGANSLLAAQGLSSSSLGRASGSTTAIDAAEWAKKLLEGSITTTAQKNNMISLMNQQSLRSGVPAGSPGIGVADRAGQIGSVRYDVAIVYHPRGNYILSAFSDGGNFAAIADLAKQINQVMSQ